MEIKPQRKSLPRPGEQGHYGVYAGLIADTDTTGWDFDRAILPRRWLERKAWIYLGVYSRDFYAGMALVDAGYLATAFCYVYIPAEKFFIEDRQIFPKGFGRNFGATLSESWRLGGFEILPSEQKIIFNLRGKFDLTASFSFRQNGLSTIAPSDSLRPFHFTYKEMAIPVEGEFIGQGRRYKFSGEIGTLDYSKGYPPRHTQWNWLALVGKTESGKSLAVNLVDKFNESMENALWLDGTAMPLASAHFHYIRPPERSIWRIFTRDNVFETRFRPFGARSENINLGLLRSQFVQPYGTFDGQIRINGNTEKFIGYGVTEDHDALW
ncbi:MAG: DUF2804 domain-containing protein [Turneriella sp.]|nr:DUF2804 domain-containing protein [Turneriella sp.]